MSADLDYLLNHSIPYRMKAVDTFRLALELNRELGSQDRRMEIRLDGRLYIEGNFHGWTNPVIESGIIHCRALLEFLGIKADNKTGKLLQRTKKRSDDVGIEDFCMPDGTPLKTITVEQALSKYSGPKDDAERALGFIIKQGNKALAHLTSAISDDPDSMQVALIASKGVPRLVVSYLYIPLRLPPPDFELTKRPRGGA